MAKKFFTDESLATFVDEIKSYTDESVEDYLSDLGAITIDLEGSTEGTVAGIDADTFQGYSIDRFVMYNVGDGDSEEVETTLDADTLDGKTESELSVADSAALGGVSAEEYATKTYVTEYVNELIGGIENGSY